MPGKPVYTSIQLCDVCSASHVMDGRPVGLDEFNRLVDLMNKETDNNPKRNEDMSHRRSVILSTESRNPAQLIARSKRYFNYHDIFNSTLNTSEQIIIKQKVLSHLKAVGGGIFNVPLDIEVFKELVSWVGYPRVSFMLFGDQTIEAGKYLRSDWIDVVRDNFKTSYKPDWVLYYQRAGYIVAHNKQYLEAMERARGVME